MYVRVDHDGLARLARDLRRAGRRDVVRDLQKSLRTHIKPLVPEVRAAIRATSSKGHTRSRRSVEARPLGLREAEARGVQIKVSLAGRNAGVGIRIDPRHFPEGSKQLPLLRETSGWKRWRSPNWGRNQWKAQHTAKAFYPTIIRHVPDIQRKIKHDMEQLVARMVGEGVL